MAKRCKATEPNIPITNGIGIFLHCGLCVKEAGALRQSPKEYAMVEIGYTMLGIQVWCLRHDVNVFHMDLEGQKHPANTCALVPGPRLTPCDGCGENVCEEDQTICSRCKAKPKGVNKGVEPGKDGR